MLNANLIKIKNVLLILLMIIGYWAFTYVGSYFALSPIGLLVIILIVYKLRPETWKSDLGLGFDKTALIITIALLVVTFPSCYLIIRSICIANQISFNSQHTLHPLGILQRIGQTFNEELICALALYWLKRKFENRYLLFILTISAVLFSAAHFVMYAFNMAGHRGLLSLLTLFNLFLTGLLRHGLILYTDHIYYAWVIHFGWNTIFFGGFFQKKFMEPELFNTFIGTKEVLFLLILLLLVSGIIIFFTGKKRELNVLS